MRKTVAHSLPCSGTTSSYPATCYSVRFHPPAIRFGSVSPRKKPRSRRCSVTKHSGGSPIFSERRSSSRVGQRETRLVRTDSHPRTARRKRRRNINKFQNLGALPFWSDERRQNLRIEFLEGGVTGVCASTAQFHRKKVVCEKDGLLLISLIDRLPVNHRSPARAVVACSLSNSESIRERRARRGFAASRRKSSQEFGPE
jgi:hypothetical protein